MRIQEVIGKIYAHGFSQGTLSLAQGGRFHHGFISAAFTAGLAPGIQNSARSDFGRIVASSVVGGTASVLGGGKFANGAVTGAFVMLFNHMQHPEEIVSSSSSDPLYEYNGKGYETKGELYGAILLDQAAEQFGIKDIVSLAAVLDNQGLLSKPFQMEGASKGTSLASKYGAKLLPQELPKRVPTHFRNGTLRYTKVFGRFLGRMAGPVGWGILLYDVGMTLYNTQKIYNNIINGK